MLGKLRLTQIMEIPSWPNDEERKYRLLHRSSFDWHLPACILAPGRSVDTVGFFILTVTGMALLMGRLMCSRCMNFACPFNSVEKTLRETFFAHNPIVGQAWQGKGTNREGKDSGDSRL
jgi:hypothetical protein